jgi:hypothetical protein
VFIALPGNLCPILASVSRNGSDEKKKNYLPLVFLLHGENVMTLQVNKLYFTSLGPFSQFFIFFVTYEQAYLFFVCNWQAFGTCLMLLTV